MLWHLTTDIQIHYQGRCFSRWCFFPVFVAMFHVYLSPPLWCRSSLEWFIVEIKLRKFILCFFRLFYLYFCLHFEFCYSNRFSPSLGIVQAGFFFHEFFLYDFALMHLENSLHFSNLCDNFWFNAIWHKWYAIIIGLT